MDSLEILKQQVQSLEKLVEIENAIIADLERRLQYLSPALTPFFPMLCQHEHPFPWHATIPPACKKCGHMAPNYTITSISNT